MNIPRISGDSFGRIPDGKALPGGKAIPSIDISAFTPRLEASLGMTEDVLKNNIIGVIKIGKNNNARISICGQIDKKLMDNIDTVKAEQDALKKENAAILGKVDSLNNPSREDYKRMLNAITTKFQDQITNGVDVNDLIDQETRTIKNHLEKRQKEIEALLNECDRKNTLYVAGAAFNYTILYKLQQGKKITELQAQKPVPKASSIKKPAKKKIAAAKSKAFSPITDEFLNRLRGSALRHTGPYLWEGIFTNQGKKYHIKYELYKYSDGQISLSKTKYMIDKNNYLLYDNFESWAGDNKQMALAYDNAGKTALAGTGVPAAPASSAKPAGAKKEKPQTAYRQLADGTHTNLPPDYYNRGGYVAMSAEEAIKEDENGLLYAEDGTQVRETPHGYVEEPVLAESQGYPAPSDEEKLPVSIRYDSEKEKWVAVEPARTEKAPETEPTKPREAAREIKPEPKPAKKIAGLKEECRVIMYINEGEKMELPDGTLLEIRNSVTLGSGNMIVTALAKSKTGKLQKIKYEIDINSRKEGSVFIKTYFDIDGGKEAKTKKETIFYHGETAEIE